MKTSPKRSNSVIENERIGLVFAKTVSIISGTVQEKPREPKCDSKSIYNPRHGLFILRLVFCRLYLLSGTGNKVSHHPFSKGS